MPTRLAEVDLAEIVGRFTDRLHRAGLPITPTAAARFTAALELARPTRTDELFWLARVTLVADREHFGVFRAVFDNVFGAFVDTTNASRNTDAPPSRNPRSPGESPQSRDQRDDTRRRAGTAPQAGESGHESAGTSADDDTPALQATASDDERLRAQAFGTCSPDELERLRAMVSALRLDPPLRRARRSRVHRSGAEVDLRATLRAAGRSGGDPVRPVLRRRRRRPRRVVLIADVSGSMESYGRAYLYLLHGAVRAVGAEAFVFATRLHRLTRPLALHRPAVALSRAMESAPDWSGGTRIGEALRAFNNGHARRGVARGAIVVIVSDGWESGSPQLLGREMERLARLAHRVIWVNPRKQKADYQPLVGGMAAALPYVDTFLSGHSVDALHGVIAAISSDAPRTVRSATRGTVPIAETQTAVERDRVATAIPPTSMNPKYGTVTAMSEHKQWDFFTRNE